MRATPCAANGATPVELLQVVRGDSKQVERIVASFKAFGPVPVYLYYRLLKGIGELLRVTMDDGP
ncbi:hypothetical protein [Archangium violaceum]|uniref:Uncharacterized protein n=1 Tax=Archangium violaceum Cb vi76 TaxID=1406225 RepID=A0A084SR86_9BACT|nr:hypothetical protein [Archangium violaceum]KFA90971.1 hypothetical protein Q664_24940 [Archangium violaceum Cb vi76]